MKKDQLDTTMKEIKLRTLTVLMVLVTTVFATSCNQKSTENSSKTKTADLLVLEKEIELRLREYESLLQKGDSISLGDMYTLDAEILPSTIGRENIIKAFGRMIRNGITGNFKTTELWGNEELLVEEGKGSWSNKNGEIVGRGKYLLIWKKDDGKWKILRDTWFPEKK